MKPQAILISVLLFSQVPAYSQQVSVQNECYRNVEEYIPPYQTPDGRYISGQIRTSRQSIPCGGYYGGNQTQVSQSVPRCDRNSSIFNGLVGGGIAAMFSKPDAYKWSVPLGVALGVSSSRVGCK